MRPPQPRGAPSMTPASIYKHSRGAHVRLSRRSRKVKRIPAKNFKLSEIRVCKYLNVQMRFHHENSPGSGNRCIRNPTPAYS